MIIRSESTPLCMHPRFVGTTVQSINGINTDIVTQLFPHECLKSPTTLNMNNIVRRLRGLISQECKGFANEVFKLTHLYKAKAKDIKREVIK